MVTFLIVFGQQLTRRLTAAGLALALSLAGAACAGEPTEEPAMTIQLPGAEPYPAELQARLRAAVNARGEGYEPRTHHRRDDGAAVYTNRLIFEDSPYLIQHAHNPVDWYPWGSEAFARAAREDKPVFLSIGYSTCHWCHVMERESFEDAEIARLLNEGFVCVKVDREQRPDVDEVYMTAVQLTTGRGGWPMSSFLTPDGKPFFGGTYFPPQHFTTLLRRVDEAWEAQRGELVASAERVTAAVAEVTAARGEAEEVGQEALTKAVQSLLASHDARLGGFGGAPKFPHEPELLFLLERALREPQPEALAAAAASLDAMARGGIYDQVGGGFHRYSTDAEWLVPHFEKMLYNQAHLARAYLDAYRLTGDAFFARVARQTLDYVLREMTSPGGGFYSATDADSEGEEGRFFVWTPDEIRAALAPEDAALALDLFAVTEAGNFEGRNILYLPMGFAEYAAKKDLELTDLLARVDRIREALWQVRERREHPIRDDKVLTAWNGMMVTALAAGSEVLGEGRYLDAARRAAEMVWKENRRGDGELWRVHLAGSSSIAAVQEDYAYLAEAFVALYDQTGETVWLARAREVVDGMVARFWDAADGGFFMSAEKGDPHLIARPKSPSDGAIPSGNSVAVRVLAQLAARTGEESYGDRARAALAAFAGQIARTPAGHAYMLLGADGLLNGEAGARRYAAAGTVKATAGLAPNGDGFAVTVGLEIRDGWHVNAHQPLQEELIATELTAASPWRLSAVEYPVPETVRLGFQPEPLAVYQGTVAITGRALKSDRSEKSDKSDTSDRSDSSDPVVPLRLRIQACNHEVCLRPEEVLLRVPAAPSR